MADAPSKPLPTLPDVSGTSIPRPSREVSRESVQAQARVIEERKAAAAEDRHAVKPNDKWQEQFATWAGATELERCHIIFGMVLTDGASTKDITRYFNIAPKELTPYLHIIAAGKAALKLKVQRNQISLGLQREDQPMFKFFLGRQFAEQVNEPVHEGVAAADSTEVKVNISVVGTEANDTAAPSSPDLAKVLQ